MEKMVKEGGRKHLNWTSEFNSKFLLFIDADCVARVKQVYDDLCLKDVFKDYRERSYKNVQHKVSQLLTSDETLKNACFTFYGQVYNNH